jgi:hypothetical protein
MRSDNGISNIYKYTFLNCGNDIKYVGYVQFLDLT